MNSFQKFLIVIGNNINKSPNHFFYKNRENYQLSFDADFFLDLETRIEEKIRITNNISKITNTDSEFYFYQYLNRYFDEEIDELSTEDILAISGDTIKVSLDDPMDPTLEDG